jgi:hypothetical protein
MDYDAAIPGQGMPDSRGEWKRARRCGLVRAGWPTIERAEGVQRYGAHGGLDPCRLRACLAVMCPT